MWWISWLTEDLLASQEEFCSVELLCHLLKLTSVRTTSFSFPLWTFHSFATRVSQLKNWHFWVIGIERNVCRCTFNRYSVITQFAKLAAGEQLCRRCTRRNYSTSKPLKVSPEKSQILNCDTVVANGRFVFQWEYKYCTSILLLII